jgi:hypothetical protein
MKKLQALKKAQSPSKEQVRQMIDSKLSLVQEPKLHLTASAAENVTNTMQFYILTNPSQGTTQLTRIGNIITGKRLKFRLSCYRNGADAFLRFVIFRWHPDNNTDLPVNSELVQTTTTATDVIYSDFLPNKPSNFQVLKEAFCSIDTYHPIVDFDWDLKMNHKIAYRTGTSAGVDNLYFAYISNLAATQPAMNFNSTFYYVDD